MRRGRFCFIEVTIFDWHPYIVLETKTGRVSYKAH
jgi:hypothetical protein